MNPAIVAPMFGSCRGGPRHAEPDRVARAEQRGRRPSVVPAITAITTTPIAQREIAVVTRSRR